MSYQLPFFPDYRTGDIIPDAILKLLVGRISNEQGSKTLDLAIGIYRDVDKSKSSDTRIKLTLSELFASACVDAEGNPLKDSEGNPISLSLSQEAIQRIHAAGASQTYIELKQVFEDAGIPSMFDGAKEV